MSQNRIPTFRIFDNKNNKVATLKSCFLKETNFKKDDYLNLKSFGVKEGRGSDSHVCTYSVIWDDSCFPDLVELAEKEVLPCVVSFQKHQYGNFAIIKKRDY